MISTPPAPPPEGGGTGWERREGMYGWTYGWKEDNVCIPRPFLVYTVKLWTGCCKVFNGNQTHTLPVGTPLCSTCTSRQESCFGIPGGRQKMELIIGYRKHVPQTVSRVSVGWVPQRFKAEFSRLSKLLMTRPGAPFKSRPSIQSDNFKGYSRPWIYMYFKFKAFQDF